MAAVEVFAYPPVAGTPPMPSWEAFGGIPGASESKSAPPEPVEPIAAAKARQEELQRNFESGRRCGFEEGRAAEREGAQPLIRALERRGMEEAARWLENFNAQRARYFETVEREVVKLALAVAARVLRRESQMDPLLLSGAVRVALGQLSVSTEVRLRVPTCDLDLWKDTIAHLPNLSLKPAVIGGEEMKSGECVLESDLGSVNLGIASQLAEIERGFFDRAGANHAPAEAIGITEDMSE